MEFDTRVALPEDVGEIARAHRDSIRTLGPGFYPADVVEAWQEGLTTDLYLDAMADGEVFFIATPRHGDRRTVLGFGTDYGLEGSTTHGTSVYVRGSAARQGIGSALIRLAEAHAVGAGATSIRVAASLAGVAFYRAHGFVEIGPGTARLKSGREMACIHMRKDLPRRSGAY